MTTNEHRLFNFIFKVTGDMEGAENAVRMAASLGQSSDNQTYGKECSQLRKQKKLFQSEWCLHAKIFCITIKYTLSHWKCSSVYLLALQAKYIFCRTCFISNTCDCLMSTPFLPAICSAEVTQVHPMICPPRVPSCRASGRKWVRLQFCIARRTISKEKKR